MTEVRQYAVYPHLVVSEVEKTLRLHGKRCHEEKQ